MNNQNKLTKVNKLNDVKLKHKKTNKTTSNKSSPFENALVENNRKDIWALSKKLKSQNTVFSNPNILLNGNFAINQRGSSSYTSSTSSFVYTVDRWCLAKLANVTCTVGDKRVTLKTTNTLSKALYAQFVDTSSYYAGRTVTFSIKYENLSGSMSLNIYDGTGSTRSIITTASSGTLTVTRSLPTNATEISCEIMKRDTADSFTVDLLEAKLEVGENATMFVPRPYEEELQACRKFYNFIPDFWGRIARNNSSRLSLVLPFGMRTTPTITMESYYFQNYTYDSSGVTTYNSGFTFTPALTNSCCTRIFASKSSHGIIEGVFYFYNLHLDSEIY